MGCLKVQNFTTFAITRAILFSGFFSTGSFNVIFASSNKIVIHEKMHSADILPTSTHFALETQSVYSGVKNPFQSNGFEFVAIKFSTIYVLSF
jgi:hypothetical protein